MRLFGQEINPESYAICLAEMMIKGSNNGILEMNKALNHNKEAGEKPIALAKQLIDFETKNIERLKKYL